MLRIPARLAAAAAAVVMIHGKSSKAEARPLHGLASSLRNPKLPTTVLVHGLDSSKQTWTSVQNELCARGYPVLAIDQRGHGESELGDPDTYSAEAVARDIIHCVEVEHGVSRPWILVGHSMGGRVAIRLSAIAIEEAPSMLGACIIEDIDCRSLPVERSEGIEGSKFDRSFPSWAEAKDALLARGYDADRVDAWRGTRVRELYDGTCWSDINPEARKLAWLRILATDDADMAWTLFEQSSLPFPIHLWIASDQATVVMHDGPTRGCLSDMMRRVPEVKLKIFENAEHSIHNTDLDAFTTALIDVIQSTAERSSRALS